MRMYFHWVQGIWFFSRACLYLDTRGSLYEVYVRSTQVLILFVKVWVCRLISSHTKSKDILDWLRDWGNTFNRAASQPSCIEHLQALSKMLPAISEHLDGFVPKMTSSHRDYEKTIKLFVDQKFPGRFSSYRELQSAMAFKNRMQEYGLWDAFISQANQRMDFQQAAGLDNGTIYKILNQVSRRLLAYAPSPTEKVNAVSEGDQHEYTWAVPLHLRFEVCPSMCQTSIRRWLADSFLTCQGQWHRKSSLISASVWNQLVFSHHRPWDTFWNSNWQ